MRTWTPHRLPDQHYCFAEDTCLSAFMRQAGRLDHDRAFLAKIVWHIRPGSVVIDGGAFLGDHAIAYAKVASLVLAFEPFWPSFLGLCCNVFVGQHFNVVPIHAALADEGCRVSFPATPPNVGAIQASEDGWAIFHTHEKPLATSIDMRQERDHDRVGLIKLDLEGWEIRALRGARHTIERDLPILVLEVNDGALRQQGTSATELVQLVEDLGYRWQTIKGDVAGPCADIIAWHPRNPYPDNAP